LSGKFKQLSMIRRSLESFTYKNQ